MVSTTLKFSKADIQPPVFVAGSFTEWSPCEMTHEKAEAPGSGYLFSCTVDLKPGQYQYKYRLGHGDWWVLDELAPTAGDDSGNVNNVLTVEPEDQKHPPNDISTNHTDDLISAVSTGKGDLTDSATEKVTHTIPSADEKRPQSPHLPNIGKKASRDEDPKRDVPRQKPEKITESLDATKEEIPDVAPPPYSVDANEMVSPSSAAKLGSPSDDKKDSIPDDTHDRKGSKQKRPSWLNKVCNTNVVLIVAIVAIPVAVSFILYR